MIILNFILKFFHIKIHQNSIKFKKFKKIQKNSKNSRKFKKIQENSQNSLKIQSRLALVNI